MTRSETKKPRFTTKQIAWIVVVGFFVILIAAYDFYVADNTRFYANWVQCGERPVGARGRGLFGVGVPHYVNQPLLSGFRDVTSYYCTPLEAERAGYSANPEVYRMPHLDAIGESWPRLY